MSTLDNKPGAVLPNLMQLEQRLMFDGAAVEASIDTLADHADDHQVVEAADDMFSLAVAHGQTQQATEQAQQQIKDYLENASAEELFQLFNGGKDTLDAQWLQSMEALRQSILSGEYQVRVEFLDNETIKGGLGAFAAEGKDGEPTIYLNRDWVEGVAGEQDIVKVLVEELGHSIDSLVNAGGDTAGDEGEAFAAAVAGTDQDGVISTDASATLDIDGEAVEVEFATYDFQTAYEIVVDIESDGEVQDWIPDENFEYAIDKESNTHNFIYTADGLGSVTVIDDTDSRYFSGNDVSAIGINIGGETYFGWISRPIKVQGEVKGFYFWTDTEFVDFATAQADGNQDGDSNTVDNRGFILAVDKAYFDSLGFVSRTGVTSDTYKVIGSSSDRVDNALNALIDSNTPPVAGDVTPVTSPATTVAIEQGYGVAGQNPEGNVLDFASDADNDTLSVISVGPGNGAVQTAVGDTSVVLNGQYGTLTLNADGTYTYVLNNALPEVDALNVGDQLSEQFTFTISDGKGETDSAILTIRIDGRNDAPTANPDYNQAKESTTIGGSGFDYTGYSASGNVTTNDTDVDDSEIDRTISGLELTGEATAGSYSGSGSSTTLTFTTSTNINSVSPGASTYVFWDHDQDTASGTTAVALAAFDGTNYNLISALGKADGLVANTTDFTLSGTPTHYWNSATSQWVAFTDVASQLQGYFEFGSANGNEAANSAKGGELVVDGASVDVAIDIASYSGHIREGMEVSATNLPAGTTVTGIEYDVSGNITSISISNDFDPSGDPTGLTLTFSSASLGSDHTVNTQYGTLVLSADGSYTYTPITDNPLLSEGESVVEEFVYTMQDSAGVESTSTLYITVYGTGSNDPYLGHDNGTAVESGIDVGGSPIGSDATGNVLDNDEDIFNGTTPGTNEVTQVAVPGSSASPISSGGSAVISGEYGNLTLASDGTYTYAVTDSLDVVDALAPGESLTEVFTYQVTNGFSKTSWATLTITISGSNDAPVAVADTNTTRENAVVPITGSVVSNDSDVDNGDSLSVTGIGTTSADTAVTGGTTAVDGTDVIGTYGTLTIGADGSYSYVVTAEIAAGLDVNDVFTYEVRDTNGGITTETLTITVSGGNEPPVNAYPAVVTTTGTDLINFTGGNEISVADQDGNLSWVVLKVDNGVLNVTAGTASVDGEGTNELRISGSQTEINAALATLAYQADTAFAGTDYLTIMSQDSDFANDSDSVEIVVEETLTVTGHGPVNEGSQYAMFEVTGYNGQTVELAVQNGTATLTSPTIEYSTDGSSWTAYGVGSEPVMPANGTLYVRVDISSEHDGVFEGSESFSLVATDANVTGLTNNASTAIVDDGSGIKYGPGMPGGTPATDTSGLDDDRSLAVTGYGPVNEGSQYAMFEVAGYNGQTVELTVQNGTATLTSPTIEYSTDGSSWTPYAVGSEPVMPANGTLYVRVDISSEHDSVYEGSETFSLVATDAVASLTDNASTAIVDDGSGTKYGPDMPGGTPATDTTGLDDDRPVISINNTSVIEGGVAQFKVELSNPSTEDITFTPSLAGVSATLGSDTHAANTLEVSTDGGTTWTTVVSDVTIAAGETSLLLRLGTSDDTEIEVAETFTLSTGTVSGTVANAEGVTGTATIGDNDAANTPPELADTNLTLTVAEDAAAPTGAVGSLLGDFTGGISDADGGALKGIAVTGIDSSKGTWYYSLDDGATWSEVGAVSETSALLLADDGSTRLYFQPTPNFNGDVASGLTFKAWDRTEGTAGTKVDTTPADATSSYTSTGGIVIPSTGSGSITELSTLDISGLTGTLADINVTLNGLSHTWPQDMDILLVGPEGQQVILMSDAGGEGTNAISDLTLTFDDEASSDLPPAGSALSSGAYKPANLIDNEDSSDLDSFDGISGSFASQLAAFDGTDPNGTWTLYIADDVATDEGGSLTNWTLTLTMSGQGSPFSTATDTIRVSVTAVNDAPLASGSSSLPSISEDSDNPPGDTVANLFTPNFDDQTDEVSGGSSANTLAGIAIIDYTEDTGKGQWQYSTDAGGSWTTLGSISGDASALTLDATAMMRFVPAADYHGDAPDVTVRLIDSSTSVINAAVVDVSNNGGITAVSADTVLLSTSVTAVNDLPTGTDDSVTTPEDIPVVLAADDFGTFADVDGDTLVKVQISTLETSGSLEYFDGTDWNPVTLNQEITKADIDAGKLRFVPGTDENGSPYTTVGFKVSDGTAYSADAYTLTVNVTPENDDFTDDDEILNVNEDSGETTGTLLSGTSSVDGPVTVKSFTIAGESGPFTLGNAYSVAGKGAITVNADGSYSFTPAANWNGAFPVISYVVTDGSGTDDTSTLTITVDPVNDDFTDDNEILNVNEDSGETTGTLLSGTSSVDGPVTVKSFTIAGESGPFTLGSAYSVDGKGTVTVNTDGSYRFTPVANWNGAFPVISYVVTDGSGTDDTSTLTITVDPVNDDFTDGNEILNVNEDSGETTGTLLSGTSSVDGPVTVKSFALVGESGPFTLGNAFTVAGKGTITVNADGSYRFTPAANWNGAFPVISYVVTDGSGTDDTSTLTINVDPVNDDFTDGNEILNVNEDSGETTGNLLSGTSSVDGPVTVKSFALVGESGPFTLGNAFTVAGKGTITVNADGSYRFTPAANWNGDFPVISYVVTDGSGTDDTSTLTITVDPVNDDFTDDNEILNVNEDSGETTGSLLSGTSSVDGPVTLKSFALVGESGPFTLGNAYSVTGKGAITVNADGSYSFTPVANWNGAFPVISYVVTDGSGTDDTSTLTITVSPVADVPEFVDESGNPLGEDVSVTTREDTPVNGKLDANDPDGDDLTFEKASDPANGTVTVDEDGNWTYTPDPDYNGNDSFTVVVRDPAGNTDTITVSITVTPENDAPVLVDGNGDPLGDDQSVITPEDTPVSGQLEAEDVDGDELTFSKTTDPANGTVTINPDGGWEYTPNPGYSGNDSFTVMVSDGKGGTDTITVNVEVTPKPVVVPPAPVAPAPSADIPPPPPPPAEVAEAPQEAPAVELGQPVQTGQILVQRDIPEQTFASSNGITLISFSIPSDTFGHTEPGAEITLSAVLSDGRPIPDWLVFDPEKGEFRGVAPKGFDGTLIIRVIARDQNGDQVETMVTIQVRSEQAETAEVIHEGKGGLMQQLQTHNQFAWKAERDRLIELARAAAEERSGNA
ncbi:hypothetical protein GCM10009104_03560 [Marinobacterium maritimum]|uniref:VCBS repeat-containing protein n=1 Tax=Marinobacterium maritimum TaxID=500162 RepID=A0ABN1I1T9_9GAMM